jgi:cyclophilin family peptidyl-prolyl cis-trans isomerase
VKNDRGTIAMARTPDPDSATAQFFINVKDNPMLDRSGANAGYCVFGKVIEGMDVVDKIKGAMTGNKGGHQNVPLQDIAITKATRADK